MTLLLKEIFSFFKLLNSDTGTYQLASGLAFGVVLGFAPALSLQTILIIFICFFFRVQLGAATLSAFFFKFVAYLFDPVSDQLGRAILESTALREIFIKMYNVPLLPLTRFNNSIFMGSAVISFALAPILFFVFKSLIIKYREVVVARYQSTKIWKMWMSTSFYQWYSKYNSLYGA